MTQLDRTIAWSLKKPSFTEQQEGDTLVIRSSCGITFGRGCSGKVHLVVPADVRVHAHSSAGYVGVTGLTGPLDLSSSAGHVDGVRLASHGRAGRLLGRLGRAVLQRGADLGEGDLQRGLGRGPGAAPATRAYRVDADSSAGSSDVSVRTDPSSSRTIVAHSSAGSVDVSYGG